MAACRVISAPLRHDGEYLLWASQHSSPDPAVAADWEASGLAPAGEVGVEVPRATLTELAPLKWTYRSDLPVCEGDEHISRCFWSRSSESNYQRFVDEYYRQVREYFIPQTAMALKHRALDLIVLAGLGR